MSRRTAKFVSASFVSLLASIHPTTASDNTPRAADSCVSGPTGAPPQGSHWYYRIDHATRRNCWYIGEEKEKLSRVTLKKSPPPANSVFPQNPIDAQRMIADAHAELALPQMRIEPGTPVTTAALTPSTAANAVGAGTDQRSNARDAVSQLSVVTSRWPEQSGANSPTSPAPAAASSGSFAPSNSAATAPTVVASVPLAAADSSSERQASSVQMLLVVIAGALALAGIMGAAVFRFGSMQHNGRRDTRDRRAIWNLAVNDRASRQVYPGTGVSLRRADIPRKLPEANDPNGRIAEMLARLSSSTAT